MAHPRVRDEPFKFSGFEQSLSQISKYWSDQLGKDKHFFWRTQRAPPGAVQPFISITSPQPGAFLDGPYRVSGTGGSLIEGNVVVRLLDGNNEIMAQKATVLQGDNIGLGGPGVWSVQFDNIYGQPQSNGSIEAFSPETGVSQSVSIWFTGR